MMKNLKALERELEDENGDSGRERRFERINISDGLFPGVEGSDQYCK